MTARITRTEAGVTIAVDLPAGRLEGTAEGILRAVGPSGPSALVRLSAPFDGRPAGYLVHVPVRLLGPETEGS